MVKQFRGGLVFEAHRLWYHSTLGSSVMKKKKRSFGGEVSFRQGGVGVRQGEVDPPLRNTCVWSGFRVWGFGLYVLGSGFRILGFGLRGSELGALQATCVAVQGCGEGGVGLRVKALGLRIWVEELE